ncbi:hypothetical protein NSMM_180005 [Nitrosomonas mobilis]|uniref:Transposase n=1 Tax=Nitrosomonas mobilis TaxID=51642 RepID=A0A1G5SBI0_9PROT|nr:hypothetical protein NSMM_180005 [Nitrosomonas mobilis]
MLFSGLCKQEPHGGICRRLTGGGAIPTAAYIRWRDKGIWEEFLEILIDDPDYEWLMVDASHCKVHPHASGARGGNQDMNRTKGAQHQDISGRGCAWYAGQNPCYTRYHC